MSDRKKPKTPPIPLTSIATATFVISTPDQEFLSRDADANVLAHWLMFSGGIVAWRHADRPEITILRAKLNDHGQNLEPPFEDNVPLAKIQRRDVGPDEITVVRLNGEEERNRITLTRWIHCHFLSQ